ncbi:MAG: HK97 family phage prohead protease [Brevundimonas sp.]
MPTIERREPAFVDGHASELEAAVNTAKQAVARGYAALAQSVDSETTFARLHTMLTGAVQDLRAHAHGLGNAHVLAELRAIIGAGAGNVSISMGDKPDQSDVAQYVDNAVETARAAVGGAPDTGRAEAFKRAAYHADTILESEATTAYQDARVAADRSLLAMPVSETEALGFRVARSEDDIRAAQAIQTRDANDIVVVGKRWDARASACPKCNAAHGEIRPLGFSFSLPGPGAHARCQCVVTLWAIDIPVPERAIPMSDTRPAQQTVEPLLLRAFIALDIDTREVDEATRTIRGAVASDETEDSHGSILKAAGWKLDRYNKNPVLIWAHKTGGYDDVEPEDLLGTTTTTIDGTRLMTDLHFSTEEVNPKAERVFRQMKSKALKGISVGFVPLKYRWEKRDGASSADEILIIDEAELVEVSVVPIPSNPNTLANQMRSFESRMRESIKDTVKTLVDEALASATNAKTDNAVVNASHGAEPTIERAQPALQENPMADNKTPQVDTLPAALAAVLGCQDVDSAVRAIADKDLATKAAKDKTEASEKRTAELEAEVKRYHDAEERAVTDMVDGLIKSGREPETKREALLITAKAAPEAFRKLYPASEEPPRRHLVERVVAPADKGTSEQAVVEQSENPIDVRIRELKSQGKNHLEAYSQALNEHEKRNPSAA